MRRTILTALVLFGAVSLAHARPPNGLGVVRTLGPRADAALSPTPHAGIDALVAIPAGKTALDLGLREVAPGIARLQGSAADVLAFGAAHPDAHVEITPRLHTLLANAQIITHVGAARFQRGANGTGAAVGIVDTGIDPTRPDFRDPQTQKSRIAWMLDLSMKPLGLHPDLEATYGIYDDNKNLVGGAVLTGQDIDDLIAQGKTLPVDVNGHGTHVASIAAGNGGGTPYIGMAPEATLIIARVTRDTTGSFGTGDTLDGVTFVYDMADALHLPVVTNLSLGTDFGPHDGNSVWEQSLAAFVGPDHPGHVLVAAAGNSGSIVDTPQHQGIAVTGTHVSVPICVGTCDPHAQTSTVNGTVQAWVALRPGANLKIGLDAPGGSWISPIEDEHEEGHTDGAANAGVIYGSNVPNTLVPQNSHGAIVIFTGAFNSGPYAVTLEGEGFADLYVDGSGDAAISGSSPAFFSAAVREATITLPASNATIIAVGCTVDNPSWVSVDGQKIGITEPVLDAYGGLPLGNNRVDVTNGEVCYFSSAGPTLTGVPKPDILAPGAVVIGAMSQQALPGSPNSIFTTQCPPKKGTNDVDPNCMQVDSGHAAALGTSMSSPMAAGIIALLLQANPLLTQDQIRAILQAGAQHGRGPSPFWDQNGAGEVDALGALDALDEMSNPDAALPDPTVSVMTLSEDYAPADGSTPITATLELRTSFNHRASLFDSSRLQAIAILGGQPLTATIVRGAAPGLFMFTVAIPPGHPNETLTLGATFDGSDIVPEATIPVALDAWTAGYPPYVGGGCSSARSGTGNAAPALLLLGLLALRRRAR
jgi:hypothetical protein